MLLAHTLYSASERQIHRWEAILNPFFDCLFECDLGFTSFKVMTRLKILHTNSKICGVAYKCKMKDAADLK